MQNTKLSKMFGFLVRPFERTGHKWDDYFGIELELEDPSVVQRTKYWYPKEDQSLRNGIEYILTEPQGGAELEKAIDEFYGLNCEFTNGPRTSTHVHLNVSDCTVEQLRCMVVAMYTIEDGLFTAIGENRKWAGYAMPLSEMDTKRLREMLSSTDLLTLMEAISPQRNQDRYYGFNTCVRKHGTVEFRYFPGGPSRAELGDWLDLIASIKKAGLNSSVEQLLNIGNNVNELAQWLQSFLPVLWYNRLVNLQGLDAMLDRFSEVTALMPDADGMERRDRLIFLTKPLVKYVTTHLFGPKGTEAFNALIPNLQVVGTQDWNYLLRQAWTADRADKDKQKAEVFKEYNVQDFDEEPLDVAPALNDVGGWQVPPPAQAEVQPLPNPFGEINFNYAEYVAERVRRQAAQRQRDQQEVQARQARRALRQQAQANPAPARVRNPFPQF